MDTPNKHQGFLPFDMLPLPVTSSSGDVHANNQTWYALQQQQQLQLEQLQEQQQQEHDRQREAQEQQFQMFNQQQQQQQQRNSSIPTGSHMSTHSLETTPLAMFSHLNLPQDSGERVLNANINVMVTNQMMMPTSTSHHDQSNVQQMSTQSQLQALQQQNAMLMNMLQNSGLEVHQMANVNGNATVTANMNTNLNDNDNFNYNYNYTNLNNINSNLNSNSMASGMNISLMKSSTTNPAIDNTMYNTTTTIGNVQNNAMFPSINVSLTNNSSALEAAYTAIKNDMKSDRFNNINNITMLNSSTSMDNASNMFHDVCRGFNDNMPTMNSTTFTQQLNNNSVKNSFVEANQVPSIEGVVQMTQFDRDCNFIQIRRNMTSESLMRAQTQPIVLSSSNVLTRQEDAVTTDSLATSLLHQACHLYPETTAVVSSAIRLDPTALSRRILTPAAAVDDGSRFKRAKRGGYTLPINIALKSNATIEVLRLLCQAGPQVLLEQDGPEGCNALTNALYLEKPKQVLELLISTNEKAVTSLDRHANFPLHVACSKGYSLDTIQLLASYYPSALTQKNFNGLTPLDIAQRTQVCGDSVTDYLQKELFENAAIHLNEYEDDLFE